MVASASALKSKRSGFSAEARGAGVPPPPDGADIPFSLELPDVSAPFGGWRGCSHLDTGRRSGGAGMGTPYEEIRASNCRGASWLEQHFRQNLCYVFQRDLGERERYSRK